jgi:hypothetical protein
VRDVRSVCAAVGLTALLVISQISVGSAASADHRANASYPSNASQMSRAEEPVPANCIRQSCGKLWCWQMNGKSSGR